MIVLNFCKSGDDSIDVLGNSVLGIFLRIDFCKVFGLFNKIDGL